MNIFFVSCCYVCDICYKWQTKYGYLNTVSVCITYVIPKEMVLPLIL